jgi:hypothetical protein
LRKTFGSPDQVTELQPDLSDGDEAPQAGVAQRRVGLSAAKPTIDLAL